MGFEYQIGGSLRADSPSYVYRHADHVFYEALRHGTFCYVLNARQMGKSSLRVQAMQRLSADGFECIFVDLTGMGRQGLTPEKWYAGFIQALVAGSSLGTYAWRSWWREQRDLLTPCQCLGVFLEEILAPALGKPLIIFVDEIDRVLSQSFSLDEFFGLIRSFSEKRVSSPPAITFALLGVASPHDLIRDPTKSPFNIGQAIALTGFSHQEAQPLLAGLRGFATDAADLLEEILEWTHGQPFLTQKLCQLVAAARQQQPEITVDAVVRSRILERWEAQDEPEHLRTVRDRILRHREQTIPCLELYGQVLTEGCLPVDHSSSQQALKLSGVVIEQLGYLYPHNRIYQTLFDWSWVQAQLRLIRPYAQALQAWEASGQPTDQHLLAGESLATALEWAADKQLSEKDYQYFAASQQRAAQLAQTSIELKESAYRLLNAAQAQAKTQARRYRMSWVSLGAIALGVTSVLMGIGRLGWIQGLELTLYDLGVRSMPGRPSDERIVLVTIDEDDIQQFGQWPISDQVLAQTIQTLQAQGIYSLGLDIYRDLPIEPGHERLVQQLQKSANLFGIEKIRGQSIPAPPSLPSQQIGFADQVVDDDGRIRRALLSMEVEGRLSFSFAVQMALDYLAQKNIELVEVDPDGARVQLGAATFHRLRSGQGAYQRVDTGGYQILLNWNAASFEQVSLQQVLNQESPPGGWRDRIVLLGVTSEGTKDFFYTPYSYRPFQPPKLMSGVAVHAQVISLLIGAALGERSLLRPCSQPVAGLWVLSSALLGAIIAGRMTSRVGQVIGSGLVILGLWGGFLLMFWGGVWVTGASGFLAWVGAQACVLGLKTQQRKRYQRQVLAQTLRQHREENTQVGELAIQLWNEAKAAS